MTPRLLSSFSKAISNRVIERRGLELPLRPSFSQALVKVLHPRLVAGLNNTGQLPRFSFANEIRRRRSIHQQLIKRHAPALRIGEELLRQHRPQAAGQLIAHRIFLLRRKRIDQPLNRLRCPAGMQCREHQMSGFRRRQREADCFTVAQLTQQYDIRILA